MNIYSLYAFLFVENSSFYNLYALFSAFFLLKQQVHKHTFLIVMVWRIISVDRSHRKSFRMRHPADFFLRYHGKFDIEAPFFHHQAAFIDFKELGSADDPVGGGIDVVICDEKSPVVSEFILPKISQLAVRMLDPVPRVVQRTEENAVRRQMPVDPAECLPPLFRIDDFRDGISGDDDQIKAFIQIQLAHILANEPDVLRAVDFLPEDIQHLFRIIDTGERKALVDQRNRQPAGSAHQLQYLFMPFAESFKKVDIKANIGIAIVNIGDTTEIDVFLHSRFPSRIFCRSLIFNKKI